MGWFAIHNVIQDYHWIFVPEWGWVGSSKWGYNWHYDGIFVPEWGWVGSADFNRNFKKLSNTI